MADLVVDVAMSTACGTEAMAAQRLVERATIGPRPTQAHRTTGGGPTEVLGLLVHELDVYR